jgi:hypothetical protein
MRFAAGMQAINHVPGYAVERISTVYDWASLGDGYIVNCMGSRDHAAVELAKNFENLKLLDQDSANVIQNASSSVPEDLQGRIEFEESSSNRRRPRRMSISSAWSSVVWVIVSWSKS